MVWKLPELLEATTGAPLSGCGESAKLYVLHFIDQTGEGDLQPGPPLPKSRSGLPASANLSMRLIPVRATYVTYFRSCCFLPGCYSRPEVNKAACIPKVSIAGSRLARPVFQFN